MASPACKSAEKTQEAVHKRSPSENSADTATTQTTEEAAVQGSAKPKAPPKLDVGRCAPQVAKAGEDATEFVPTPETTPRHDAQTYCEYGGQMGCGTPMQFMQIPVDHNGVPLGMPQMGMHGQMQQQMMMVPAHMMPYMMQGMHQMPMMPMMMPMAPWEPWTEDRRRKPRRTKRRGGAKVFVGGLGPVTTSASLQEYFEQFGPIMDAEVLADSQTRRSRGFGFVEFADGVPDGILGVEHMIDRRRCGVRKYAYNPANQPTNVPQQPQ